MIVGVMGLAYHQGVSWDLNLLKPRAEVSGFGAVIELSMFLGAALIPLGVVLRRGEERKAWPYFIWAPCILYVVGLSINFFVRSPFVLPSYSYGIIRLAGWLAIAALFIHEPVKRKPA
jgi:hypothetical protein